VVALALGTLGAGTARAGDWDTDLRLGLTPTYSDNIFLAPPGAEESDLVIQVLPAASVHGEGGRVKLDLDYAPQLLVYTSDGELRDAHRLQAGATVEALERHLFVDLRAAATPVSTDPLATGRRGTDALSRNSGSSQGFTWGLSPYYRGRLGDYGDVVLRYGYDEVRYQGYEDTDVESGEDPERDSASSRYELGVTSGEEFSTLGWTLNYSHQDVDYKDRAAEDPSFERANLRVKYPFSATWAAYAGVGYDDNDYDELGSGDSASGGSWELGGIYTPTEKTRIEAGLGERYFGSYWNLDLSVVRRRTAFQLRYKEDVTTSREVLRERQLVERTDPFGNPIPSADLTFQSPTDLPVASSEVLVRKRLEGGLTLQGQRTTTSLRVFHDQNEYQSAGGGDDTTVGGTLAVSRRLSRVTTGQLYGLWQADESGGGEGDETLWNVGLSLVRQLGRDLYGSVDLRHQTSDSELPEQDYEESRVSAGLTMSF
jgi:uncharacterized protein (PEP-CTERM system associated)